MIDDQLCKTLLCLYIFMYIIHVQVNYLDLNAVTN